MSAISISGAIEPATRPAVFGVQVHAPADAASVLAREVKRGDAFENANITAYLLDVSEIRWLRVVARNPDIMVGEVRDGRDPRAERAAVTIAESPTIFDPSAGVYRLIATVSFKTADKTVSVPFEVAATPGAEPPNNDGQRRFEAKINWGSPRVTRP